MDNQMGAVKRIKGKKKKVVSMPRFITIAMSLTHITFTHTSITHPRHPSIPRGQKQQMQKECDVLWLYGPLYNATQPQKHQQQEHSSLNCDWTTNFSQYSPQQQQPASSPSSVDSLSKDIESLAITAEVSVSPLEEMPTAPQTVVVATAVVEEEERLASSTTATAIETQSSLPSHSMSSPDSVAPDAVIAVDTAVSTTTPANTTTAVDVSIPASGMQSGAEASVCPLHIDTSAPLALKDESLSSSPTEESALSRPKSALKQLGTMSQTFEELRSFTQTPHYLALTKALESFSPTSSPGGSSSNLVALVEGTQSEPMSPITDGGNNGSSTFLLPIFPSPTKYHFRSHDRRRSSFPKSASHPSQLNVNLSMNVSVHAAPVAGGRRATIGGGPCSTSGQHNRDGRLVPSASAKQLRFSLEVQELIFLPTSPPFRISRAKPTRAHSDPAIQSVTSSSFIAPQSFHVHGQHQDGLSTAQQHSLHRAGFFSTATASDASFENTTTTFIKVRASSSSHGSRSRVYYRDDDENRPECNFNDDYFEDCREGGISTTDEEFSEDGDDEEDYDDSEDALDDEDDEYDEFNGLGRTKRHSTASRHKRRSHFTSRHYRLSSKDGIVARRPNDTAHPAKAAGPGMLWQVYTAVTGVKELIAWYGSMVYHSSSL
ncbi:hypothetical protein BKA57DRAFT_213374 [Linnemannia elongata]|nr:hypothetical protein BKA57DRAFT_213374 [Linnemannia elongata]